MALSKAERDILNRIEQSSKELAASFGEVNQTLAQLLQEVYGPPPERNNGLRGDMRCVKDRLQAIDVARARQAGFIAAISGAVTLLGLTGREIIKAVFGK